MKKLLFSLIAILFAFIGNAQVQCNASFTWSQTPTSLYPYQVTVVNNSTFTGAPANSWATYSMNWGDNSTSNIYVSGPSTHNYQSAGTYTTVLTMTVYDSINQTIICTSTYNATITTVASPCATTISTTNNGNGNYTFTANNTGGPFTYSWTFGDGGSAGNNATQNHTYTSNGTYTVTVHVTGGGMTCTATTTVNYQGGGGAPNCNNLIANFTANTQNGLTVYFYNTSTVSNNTTPILMHVSHWSFGDGTSSTTNYPAHTYAIAGTYTVTLINQWVDSNNSTLVYCTDTATQTITVTSSAANYITGGIYWDSTLNVAQSSFKVWLITFDSVTNIIDAIDSTIVNGAFNQVTYTFHNIPAGVYRTKAAVMLNSPGVSQMAPTYHHASTYWGTANLINHNGGVTQNKHIYMQAGTSTTGPGFIAGNVTLGAGKGTATGVPNLLILLRNSSNQMVAFTYTDANGDYSFSNIPLGTYNIYPENMPQITTPSSSMTITATTTQFNSIDFVKNSKKIIPKNLGVTDLNAQQFTVHPNPAKDVVTISWNNTTIGNATIVLVDMSGRVLLQTNTTTNNDANINIGSVPSGMYFLKITNGTTQQTEKLMIQK